MEAWGRTFLAEDSKCRDTEARMILVSSKKKRKAKWLVYSVCMCIRWGVEGKERGKREREGEGARGRDRGSLL